MTKITAIMSLLVTVSNALYILIESIVMNEIQARWLDSLFVAAFLSVTGEAEVLVA